MLNISRHACDTLLSISVNFFVYGHFIPRFFNSELELLCPKQTSLFPNLYGIGLFFKLRTKLTKTFVVLSWMQIIRNEKIHLDQSPIGFHALFGLYLTKTDT